MLKSLAFMMETLVNDSTMTNMTFTFWKYFDGYASGELGAEVEGQLGNHYISKLSNEFNCDSKSEELGIYE